VAEIFEVASELLLRRTRLAGVAEARAVFCALAVEGGGQSGAEVARMLRMSRVGVSLAVRRDGFILQERPELRRIKNFD